MYFNYLEKADPDITAAMKREINRQETKIEMIAIMRSWKLWEAR